MTDITIYKQIYPNQCITLMELGYASIINTRPDDEAVEQPRSQLLAKACDKANLTYHHIPYDCDRLSQKTIQTFAQAVNDSPEPILVFCGTGHRAKMLYQTAAIQGLI